MKTKIEELIEEKLNQEFPEEVEIREDPDYDSEEEMTSETEETDDSESQTNNANVNNYLDSAKMVIKNPEKVNAAIVNGKQSKEYFHRVTGHAGHHLMDATAKYYKVDLTGKVNNCLSCSLEKIRQKNIPKKMKTKMSVGYG